MIKNLYVLQWERPVLKMVIEYGSWSLLCIEVGGKLSQEQLNLDSCLDEHLMYSESILGR